MRHRRGAPRRRTCRNHLASGEARIGERSARDESSRRIHVRHRRLVGVAAELFECESRQHRADVFDLHIRRMLRRKDKGRYHGRLTSRVPDTHLRLPVWA